MRNCGILGVNITVTNMNETVEFLRKQARSLSGQYICVSNVHTTVMSYYDPIYRKIQNGAALTLPDGGPLSAVSRKRGFLEAARVTGPDLMEEIFQISEKEGFRHFFYGDTDGVLLKLKKELKQKYPNLLIVGMLSPPFRELSREEEEKDIKTINETKPDFVWVGLGAPKQERWMAANKDRVHGLMIGVGAAFKYHAGLLKRAPKWMQDRNLEWLFRLCQDPVRLFKRYLVTNLKFLWLIRKDAF